MSEYYSEYKQSVSFNGPANAIKIAQPTEPTNFIFNGKDGEAGRITIKDGRMSFTGEVDESAKVFFDHLCNCFPQLKGEDNE